MFSKLPGVMQLMKGKESSVGRIWEHFASFQPLDCVAKVLPTFKLGISRKSKI